MPNRNAHDVIRHGALFVGLRPLQGPMLRGIRVYKTKKEPLVIIEVHRREVHARFATKGVHNGLRPEKDVLARRGDDTADVHESELVKSLSTRPFETVTGVYLSCNVSMNTSLG